MIVYVTTADTEILALSRAVRELPDDFPPLKLVNPNRMPEDLTPEALVDGASMALVRLLGGRRAWQEGFDRLAQTCAQPDAFQQQWADAERDEQQRLLDARQILPQVRLSDDLLNMIAGICNDFGVDGMRADIVMHRAAVALAAYEGRMEVSEDDIRRVAPLVLPHRRQPFDEPNVDDRELDESIERHRPPVVPL